ncbi:hypothetical protein H1R20_g6984, partial [Candolleomyces eurysporus]
MIAGTHSADIGFSNISCIEIQVEGEESPVSEQLVHIAIYARQLFIHQPNRRFVRVLVLTGQYLRLFHFDRSGVQYTPLLDIHTNPHTFVRLVLGLSSPNENDIGLDTSIQWRVENGRKVSGTLKTRGADDIEIIYPLHHNVEPFFRRPDICGRCTTCWSISDPVSREELIVKDSWRPHNRTSEYICLREALGISGVVQMLSYESDRGQTAHLRGFRSATCSSDFENRVNTRVVIKCYGDPVTKFTSATELLCALRDAIAAHIIHVYNHLGIFHSVPYPLNLWHKYEGHDAAGLKLGFLAVDSIPYSIASRWPEACVNVLYGFRAFLRSIIREKIRITHEKPANATAILKSLRSSAEDHYAHVLRLFDDGIAALEKAEAEDTATRCVTPAPLIPAVPSMRPSTERILVHLRLGQILAALDHFSVPAILHL